LAAGESSGNLDVMLEEVNSYYERDVEYAVEALTRMIEPLMTVLVGGIVLLILLALYMPVFSLGKALNAK
jgi:type IV pilus assembly protein PilC